jgi:hypothetical protein
MRPTAGSRRSASTTRKIGRCHQRRNPARLDFDVTGLTEAIEPEHFYPMVRLAVAAYADDGDVADESVHASQSRRINS